MISIARATYTPITDLMALPVYMLAHIDAEVYDYCDSLHNKR